MYISPRKHGPPGRKIDHHHHLSVPLSPSYRYLAANRLYDSRVGAGCCRAIAQQRLSYMYVMNQGTGFGLPDRQLHEIEVSK